METRSCGLRFLTHRVSEAFLLISKPTAQIQTHREQAQGLSQGDSLLSSLTGYRGVDLSSSQMSLTTMVANYPTCTELLAWYCSHAAPTHKLLYPIELFWLPGKFKPLISCQTEETTSRSCVCFYLYVRPCLRQQRAVT